MGPKRTLSISRKIRFLFFQSKCEVTIKFVVWEDKNLFVSLTHLSFYLSLFSWITQASPIGPPASELLWPKQTSQERNYVFKLPALSQHQYLDSHWDCEKAGNSQLGFSFPVVMLAIKSKRVSIWLPLKQSCSAHFIQEKRCHPKGPFRMYVSWMVLRVFHSLF